VLDHVVPLITLERDGFLGDLNSALLEVLFGHLFAFSLTGNVIPGADQLGGVELAFVLVLLVRGSQRGQQEDNRTQGQQRLRAHVRILHKAGWERANATLAPAVPRHSTRGATERHSQPRSAFQSEKNKSAKVLR